MKPIVAALGLVVALGGLVWLTMAGDEPPEREAAAASREGDGPARRPRAAEIESSFDDEAPRSGSLEQRVARLEKEVTMLRRQLALRGRVAAAGGGVEVDELVDDPVLDAQVREIFTEEREREREQRMERRRERMDQQRAETLDELVQLASLTTEQRDAIDELWTTEADRVMTMFSEARAGERDFEEVRDEIRTARTETDDAVRAMLSESQFSQYDELRPRGPERGGRGGRDGGERRGGPPRDR